MPTDQQNKRGYRKINEAYFHAGNPRRGVSMRVDQQSVPKQVKGMALTAPCQLTSDGRADRFSPILTAFPRFFEEIREKRA